MAKLLALVMLFTGASALAPRQAEAAIMSKKVLVMYKAAGYGAAAGLVVGAATWVMGIGTAKNIMVGTSLGMYTGIIFGAYILMSHEDKSERTRYENPYRPGQKVGPGDWEDEPDDTLKYRGNNKGTMILMETPTLLSRLDTPRTLEMTAPAQQAARAVWMPLVAVGF